MAKRGGGNGEYEHHIVSIRLRVTGQGNLKFTLQDLDDVQNQTLAVLPMFVTTRFEPTRLANFQSQRTRLYGRVTEINEYFQIGRIIIFAKPVAIEYPG